MVFERVVWVAQLDGLALQTAGARIATGKSAFAKDPHLKKINYNLIFEDVPFLSEFYRDSTAWAPTKYSRSRDRFDK